jgi:hypothetical protein
VLLYLWRLRFHPGHALHEIRVPKQQWLQMFWVVLNHVRWRYKDLLAFEHTWRPHLVSLHKSTCIIAPWIVASLKCQVHCSRSTYKCSEIDVPCPLLLLCHRFRFTNAWVVCCLCTSRLVEEECGSRSLRLARAHVLEDHLASLLCSGALLRLILKLLPLVCLEQLHFGLI